MRTMTIIRVIPMLVLLVMSACGGGGGTTPTPTPQPVYLTQIENTSFTYESLDNPGSHTFMDGDRSRLMVTGTVYATKDGRRTNDSAFISNIVADLGYVTLSGITQVSHTGNGLPMLTLDEIVPVSLKDQTEQTATPQAIITAFGPPTGSDYTKYTFTVNGPNMTVKPAQEFSYSAMAINPNVIANIDEISNISSNFINPGNHSYMTSAQWKSIYMVGINGIVTTTKYELDSSSGIINVLRLTFSDGSIIGFVSDKRKDLYDLQRAWLKTP